MIIITICPGCASDMNEIEPDVFICPACNTTVEQLSLFEGEKA